MADLTILYHLANVLFLLAFAVKDILWLRLLTISGSFSVAAYYYWQPGVNAANLYWSSLYIVLNVIHITIILYERRPTRFTDEQAQLYRLVFRTLTPWEFRKFLRLANWRNAQPSQSLVEQGTHLDHVIVILSGTAAVQSHGKTIAELTSGHFVGEMSLIGGDTTTADVVAVTPTRYVAWSRDKLGKLLERHPSLRAAWQLAIGKDLAAKLRTSTS